MNILMVLIPVSLLLGGGWLVAFFWSLRASQFEDPKGEAMRILSDRYDDAPADSPGERSRGRCVFPAPVNSEEETQLDHSAHQPLTDSELTESKLLDATIYGPGDEKVGTVSHVHGIGQNRQLIVDVGGFLGIGAKPVALNLSQLRFMRDENGRVHATTPLTKDEAKALPEHHHTPA